MGGGEPVNSVQDLSENFGFAEREAEEEGLLREETKDRLTQHYSIRNCKNLVVLPDRRRWELMRLQTDPSYLYE